MKDILILYAKYNRDTNNKIIEILSSLSDNERKQKRYMYYKSIHHLFHHLIQGEWHYLNAIMHISRRKYGANLQDREKTFLRIGSSFAEAVQVLRELDNALVGWAEDITEAELKMEKKNVPIYNGRIVDITVWHFMTQQITHQIHHQGQLSQVFDEMGIEHEFGNIFPYVPDASTSG